MNQDSDITRIGSIGELRAALNLSKPDHPLITILDTTEIAYGQEVIGHRFTTDLYCIALKDRSCGLDYGRNTYDFDEGVLMFTAPDQVFSINRVQELNEVHGWMLYFHPDLIRNTSLGLRIDDFSYFNYDVHEALHLSQSEQDILTNLIQIIKSEVVERIDNHSQQVLVSNIELILNYCSRFYERQFNTRAAQNKDVVSKVEWLLKEYYRSNRIIEEGQPSIQFLAEQCHLSSNYLSDLLVKETGRTAKDHINNFLVSKSKDLLLGSEDSISEIAYSLGFNYPHYFARLFKQKVGLSPSDYRSQN